MSREMLAMAGRDLITELRAQMADDSARTKRAGVIPVSLRVELRATADRAEQFGDSVCPHRLREVADYEGHEAPRRVRELAIQACDRPSYPAVGELMRFVRLVESEKP